jgi:hypothetical protein
MAAYITAQCRVKVWREWRAVERGPVPGYVTAVNADSLRYVKGSYTIPVLPEIGDFSVKFSGATVTHYGSGRALVEHTPVCKCGDCKGAVKLMPGSKQFKPEIHAAECACERCDKAPRVTLRKRGFPSLNAAQLLTARGYELEVIQRRPLTINEGIIQHRMKDVGVIPDDDEEIDPMDGARRRNFSLLSNLRSAVYSPKDLTFPRLNRGAVVGTPMSYEAVFSDKWVKEAVAMRRVTEAATMEAISGA